MGIKTMSFTDGTAETTVTGGTPVILKTDSVTVANGIHLQVISDSDYRERRQVTVKHRAATVDPKTSFYGKDKKSITIVAPLYDEATGKMIFNTFRLEREVHPSFSDAEIGKLNALAIQALSSPDVTDFWLYGTFD